MNKNKKCMLGRLNYLLKKMRNEMFNNIQLKIITFSLLIFLSPFSINAQQGGPLDIISSLTSISGTGSASENPLLPDDEVLEEEEEIKELIKKKNDIQEEEFGYTGDSSYIYSSIDKSIIKPLEYFGYDYFTKSPSTFAPVKNISIPSDYLIGPDDNIKIILYGNENVQFTLQVNRDGEIYFPELGPISVAGLTFSDLKETLSQVISSNKIGTKISITLGTLRSINIFILGDAYQPGRYTLGALSSLTNAIFISGGVNTSGSLRNIQVKRNGKVISEFDFYEFLLNGDNSNDVRLMDGDVIFIPSVSKHVAIDGEVSRPGIYELRENEDIQTLISFAGNIKPKGSTSSIDIQRIDRKNNSFIMQTIDLDNKTEKDYELINGDKVIVYPVSNLIKNAVLVRGHAQKTGFYTWKNDMKVSDIIGSPDNLLYQTDLSYLLIKREEPNTQNYSFYQIDLTEIFENNDSTENIVLKDRDELILFPKLLSPEEITTKIVSRKIVLNEDGEYEFENTWSDLSYLRKSIQDNLKDEESEVPSVYRRPLDPSTIEGQLLGQRRDLNDLETALLEEDKKQYYEYTVHNYCTLPETIVKTLNRSVALDMAIEESGLTEIEAEASIDDESFSYRITQECRKQLMDPIIDLINRQSDGDKSQLVSIYGNVQFQGKYPLTKNMNIKRAIDASGGFQSSSYDAEIELSRRNLGDKEYVTRNNFISGKNQDGLDTPVKGNDILTIKQVKDDIKTVTISGEVYFPGTYPIAENQTLSDLITRAGGLTSIASPDAAFFQRDILKKAEQARLKEASAELRRKIILGSQSAGLGQETLSSGAITQLSALLSSDQNQINEERLGRLVIDLKGIIDGKADDIVLEDGDNINIPIKRQTVSVIGEVNSANSHLFSSDTAIDDYIDLSGGITTFGDERNIYIIKADGSINPPDSLGSGFFRSSQLEPGDTIVVPIMLKPFSTIRATTEVTQIIYQMALAAAAVNSF